MSGTPDEVRLLIVDDDFLFTDMLPKQIHRAIRSPTFQITTTRSPDDAMRLLSEEVFDVVLCDFDLKAAHNGLDVLQHVSGSPARPFRILYSGHQPREIPVTKDAYDAFFEKPMTLREVVPKLTELIEAHLGFRIEHAGR